MSALHGSDPGRRGFLIPVWITQWALVLGSIAFLLIWMNSILFNDEFYGYDLPWALQLAIHGCSILLLTIGLVGVAQHAAAAGAPLILIGSAAAAVIGLWTVGPLIYVGLAGVGLGITIRRGVTMAGPLLIVGAALFLSAWASGAKPGFEDAPDPNTWQKLLAGPGVTLAAAGCAALGVRMRVYVS